MLNTTTIVVTSDNGGPVLGGDAVGARAEEGEGGGPIETGVSQEPGGGASDGTGVAVCPDEVGRGSEGGGPGDKVAPFGVGSGEDAGAVREGKAEGQPSV